MRNKGFSRYLYWLMPAMMFVLAETVMGNLEYISGLCVVLNLAIFYMLYLGVYAVFRTTKYGWPVLNLMIYVLAVLEYFVISFRERPAMIWDVLAIRTAMTVSANYNFALTPTLVFTFLALIVLCIWAWRCGVDHSRKSGTKRLKATVVWFGCSAAYMIALFLVIAPKFQLDVPMWDPVVSFEKEGVVLSTALSFKSVIAPKPDGYSEEEARLVAVKYSGAKNGSEALEKQIASQTVPTNVICIMNESFSDFRLFNGLPGNRSFETDKPFLAFYDTLSHTSNTQKGNLYVPVFGAMTANAEYEVLTGNSCAFVPQGSIPYQYFTKQGDNSLAKIFGEYGYKTVAMHPYPGYNWSREEAYENLGFDQFLDQEFYDELEAEFEAFSKPRGYLSDQSNYEAILSLLKEKNPEEKLFVFNVTMQNHGGFEVEGLESTVHVTELNGEPCAGDYPKADQYLTLMEMSDEALEYLLEELKKLDEPTMVVLFGDHQPSVETEFFEELYGARWTEIPTELKLNSFTTPYMIWTNYDRNAEQQGNMSSFLLGSQILKEAGLEQTGLFGAAEPILEQYEAVHAMGVLSKDGTFYDGRETRIHDTFSDIREYHVLQYYEIFE